MFHKRSFPTNREADNFAAHIKSRVVRKDDTGGAHVFWYTPKMPQSQESLKDQLRELAKIADTFGLYDAADFISLVGQ